MKRKRRRIRWETARKYLFSNPFPLLPTKWFWFVTNIKLKKRNIIMKRKEEKIRWKTPLTNPKKISIF